MIVRVLLILLLWTTPASAAVVWFAGIETGDFNEFSQLDTGGNHTITCSTGGNCTGATCTDTSHAPHSGCYAAKFTGATANAGFGNSKQSLNLATAYTRMYFMPLTISGSTNVVIMGVAADTIALVLNTNGTLKFCAGSSLTGCTAIATGSTVLSINNWYLIETKQVISTTVGGMELKVNGKVEFTSFGSNTGSTNIPSILFGPYKSAAGNSAVYLYDSIAISDSGYLGAGLSIARQGASGSPTYTAWTKNSCTSSLIENCWSQTPFNATPNATSSTATDAQTMLVATFSSTQAGHGSETIAATSTINACTTFAIMKSGTSSAPVSIRRRLSGVDTDTAQTLTTSDAAYNDGVWTTTPAVLRGASMEIGMLHGAGVATDQVEDMWMMCDFSTTARIRHGVIQQ